MPEQEITVEPRPGATPPPEAPESGGVELPEELLQLPAMQGLVSGAPAAFSATLTEFEKLPEAAIIAKNKDALMRAGMGFYRSLDGARGVVFNGLFLSPEEIQNADQSGALLEIAPPFAAVNQQIASSGSDNPALQEGERPTGFKQGSGAVAPALPPTTTSPKPQSAAAQKTIASKRAANLAPSSPTSGSNPGGGRLLASIMKPVL